MSLLNDMLRDLEKRQGNGDSPRQAVPASLASRPGGRESRSPLLWIGVLLVLVALVVAAIWWMKRPAEPGPLISEASTGSGGGVQTQAVQVLGAAPDTATVPDTETAPVTEIAQEPEVLQGLQAESLHGADQPKLSSAPAPAPAKEPAAFAAASVAVKSETPQSPVVEEKPELQTQAAPEPVLSSVGADGPVTGLPEESEAKAPLARLEKKSVVSAGERDRLRAGEARRLLDQGRVAEAQSLLENELAMGQAGTWSRLQLAELYVAQGLWGDAAPLLENFDTDSLPQQRQVKALWLLGRGDSSEALALLSENPPDLVPDTQGYYATLAALLQQLGRPDEAALRYAELLEQEPAQADWWVGLALALESGGRPGNASEAYQRALALRGLHPDLQAFARERLSVLRTRG